MRDRRHENHARTVVKLGFLTTSVSRMAGGLHDAVRGLALGLAQRPGLRVQVYGLTDEWSDKDAAGWGTVPLHLQARRGPRSFGYAAGLEPVLLSDRPDMVHAHGLWTFPSVVNRRFARKTGTPYLISPHGMLDAWALRHSRWKKRLAGWLYESGHLHGAACLHALCDAEVRAIRDYGLRNPVCLIPNGVDLPGSTPVGAPSWRGHLPDNAKILLYLGRLHPKKGLSNLLKAWATLNAKDADAWHLVIAGWGQGDYEQRLKLLAREYGVQSHVHFVGPQYQSDKLACFRQADAFILPSYSEGLPMVVLEAWSHGLPVLMTPQCNLPEGYEKGAALKIEATAEGIDAGLAALFSMSDSGRKTIGARGLALIRQRYLWPGIARDMHGVYEWILGHGPRPACVVTE